LKKLLIITNSHSVELFSTFVKFGKPIDILMKVFGFYPCTEIW